MFEATADPAQPDRVGLVRWSFPGWPMPPNSSVAILFRYSLEPGVLAGQVITNTMGASSAVENLVCTPPDVEVPDGVYGAGRYCTDPAQVTVTAGANFVSRKWVAGNPALGWYNQSTGQVVPVGGGGCLSLSANGRTYTTNPCIALVNPGERFHYVLRVQNAGTESALRMTVVDDFPAPGDTGVLGADRGTQWSTAPMLVGPATYNGPATGVIGYTSGAACIDDLTLDGPPCAAGSWDDAPGPTTTALRLAATFDPDPLPPGGSVDVSFSMDAPLDVPRVADPTIAWNSLAHAEVTRVGDGGTRTLPALEPLKVGVATLYGQLQVVKRIRLNPGNLPLDDTPFTFAYDCTISTGTPGPAGTVDATPTTPGVVTGIPSGSTCAVWETGTNGGIPNATAEDPVEVVIQPSLDPQAPVVSSVTVVNDFPLGHVEVLKAIAGGVNPDFTVGPFLARVDCTFGGTSQPGFPVTVALVPGVIRTADLPVGTLCTVTELDLAGGAEVTYDPPAPGGGAAQVVVPPDGDRTATVSVTNGFDVGSLVVRKAVSGPGAAAFGAGPFAFDVTCAYRGHPNAFSTTVTVAGAGGGAPVESEPVTGLPAGARCTVTETDAAGADVVPPPVTVTIVAGEQAEAVVAGFDNPFSAATISVVKRVDGDAADSAYVAGLRFTVAVECTVERDGQLVTVLDDTVSVAGDGVAVPVTGDDGIPALVPFGTRCWGTETDAAGASRVVVDHDSYANGVEVVAGAEVQPLQITVTNTFDPAVLVITKRTVDPPDPNAAYTINVTCTITSPDGVTTVPLLVGTSPLQLRGGQSAAFETLTGARCTVTEPDPGGAQVTISESGGETGGDDGDPTDGVVTLAGDRAVVVTNTFTPEGSGVLPASGALPGTGAGTAPRLLGLAAAVLALGVLLVGGGFLGRRHRLPVR